MPRAGLTRDRVAEEAAAMADEVGLATLTLSALAERLGVRQPSLYKHIDSMAGLHRDIAVRAKRDLGEVLARASAGRSGAEAISAMSHAYRAWALQHPARYEAANRMPAPGDVEDEAISVAAVQVIADVLTAYRLDGNDAVDAIRAFRSTLHGFVSYETAGAFQWSADIDRSFERLVGGFIVALDHRAETADRSPSP
ncbi:TetR family transcriptional regulator [Rathayibacter sp. VKM Ac-2803]|uniref:TetR/AcrR family transcriptional regulator n=1 Tax=Rathayibacter sp. VKM Ac-2803 TaxID=2609256 RepID=UPI00135CB552|nr:TetR-like C-terminal domain-containing protein [Rathayibacter sp. VKM Ac-2803]MWV49126.1 TetR family transcriptional regulator [Rathayibacter sp. VKM Ac-2803]